MRTALSTCAAALLALAGGACGGDPFCGDGNVDVGELCDDGNDDDTDFCLSSCTPRAIPALTVKWSFNEDAARGFTGDSCTDLGARDVTVSISGGGISESASDSCSLRQVIFSDIPSATYSISVEVRDAEGVLLTDSVVTADFEFVGGTTETTVIVPHEAWTASYDGNYYFRTAWGGADCTAATTPVVTQILEFERDGSPVAAVTKAGDALDGATSSPCRSQADAEPQTVLGVPFGPATLRIQGLDATETPVYDTTFETFIGAGLNNPELLLDVQPL